MQACLKLQKVYSRNPVRKPIRYFSQMRPEIFLCLLCFIFYDTVKKSGNKNYLNNAALIDFIKSRTSTELRGMLQSYSDMRAMTSYISSDESPQTQGVLSELQQIVRNIFVGNFCKKGTLGLRDLVRKKGGRKIFIEYDLSYGEMLTPIYSLMFDMAIKEALGRSRSDGNVYFITR